LLSSDACLFVSCLAFDSFALNSLRVLRAYFILVKRYDGIVGSAHAKSASGATEDRAFYPGIVDLARWAAFSETIEKAFVSAEVALH